MEYYQTSLRKQNCFTSLRDRRFGYINFWIEVLVIDETNVFLITDKEIERLFIKKLDIDEHIN